MFPISFLIWAICVSPFTSWSVLLTGDWFFFQGASSSFWWAFLLFLFSISFFSSLTFIISFLLFVLGSFCSLRAEPRLLIWDFFLSPNVSTDCCKCPSRSYTVQFDLLYFHFDSVQRNFYFPGDFPFDYLDPRSSVLPYPSHLRDATAASLLGHWLLSAGPLPCHFLQWPSFLCICFLLRPHHIICSPAAYSTPRTSTETFPPKTPSQSDFFRCGLQKNA